ncbi:MAG TPA: hypothetical protein PKE00_00790 [Planctomycetota bacterium]|nr:hypothetical protein [Planctomycetota bacterium]
MAYEKFSMGTLLAIDGGRIREAFEMTLAQCEQDMADRPGVKAARKVTLTITLTPDVDEEGNLCAATVGFDVTLSMPKRKSRDYAMRAEPNRGLWFNEYAPENPNQRTVDEGLNDPRKAVHNAG